MREWSVQDIKTLRDGAISGLGCEAIARDLKRRQEDVRQMAELIGVSLSALASVEWCDRCCRQVNELDPDTGWCIPCTAKWRIERQREADEAEEERLREEAVRAQNAIDKQRQRMREQYGANPRKRSE